jgi:hypothetical protein
MSNLQLFGAAKSDQDRIPMDPDWYGSLIRIRIEVKAGSGSALKLMRIRKSDALFDRLLCLAVSIRVKAV